jgi:hypothetical protein
MLSIGIAIPAHYDHLQYIYLLCIFFQKQTIQPNKISISISSCPKQFKMSIYEDDYDFPIHIHTTSDKKNPAQNRNIAATYLDTDIISFIDVDDLPHIQRNEIILAIFEANKNCDVIVHNYEENQNKQNDMLKPFESKCHYYLNYIDTILPNVPFPISSKKHMNYHCAHVSLRKKIFDDVKYNEDWFYFRNEDSLYLKDIMQKKKIKLTYITNKLSWYRDIQSSILIP